MGYDNFNSTSAPNENWCATTGLNGYDGLYVRSRPGKVKRTLEFHGDVLVDVDDDGLVVGVEFLT